MFVRTHFLAGLAAAVGGLLLFTAACSDSPIRTGPSAITAGGSKALGTAERNKVELCKVYSGISGGAVTFNVSILINNTGSPVNSTVTVQPNSCVELHSANTTQTNADRVTITEPALTGFTTQVLITNANGTTSGPTTTNTATVFVHNDQGSVVEFINTSIPSVLGEGRFTGGGNVEVGDIKISNGLTLHCDRILSNNFEINWKDAQGNEHKFKMTTHTAATCSDNPNIQQPPPAAPIDTMVGTATGEFDGTAGYTLQFTIIDGGEPGGGNDQIALRIFQTSNTSNVVLNVPLQDTTKGNLQAHFDQPHK